MSQVAFQVGYASASRFSREYTRLYGQPPSMDKKAASDRWDDTAAGRSATSLMRPHAA
nr:hypothetical protein [Bradyrhizobium sp. CCBAU 53340]